MPKIRNYNILEGQIEGKFANLLLNAIKTEQIWLVIVVAVGLG